MLRQKQSQSWGYRSLIIFMCVMVIFLSDARSLSAREDNVDDERDAATQFMIEDDARAPKIDGKAYVLYAPQTGTFITGRDADTQLHPASITKTLTILMALENLDMNEQILVTREMYENIDPGYVRLGLVEDELISVEDAIYASMLISANDACTALAIHMGGSVDGFSKMMNERAKELGCKNTSFTNPFGHGEPGHLTTAHDLALIMSEVIKHEAFTKVALSANYVIVPTNKYSENRSLTNGNRFISSTDYSYDYYIGGKTGFTAISGHTVAAAAEYQDQILIAVILGASGSEIRYANLIDLFTYGFNTFTTSRISGSELADERRTIEDRVMTSIENAGYSYVIESVDLDLIPYITVERQLHQGGYYATFDTDDAVIHANLTAQELSFPAYRNYADGSKILIGTLKIYLIDQTVEGASAITTKTDDDGNVVSIAIQIVVILFLCVLLGLIIYIFVLLHLREKKRKRRYDSRLM